MKFQIKQIKKETKKICRAIFSRSWLILVFGCFAGLAVFAVLFWKFILLATKVKDEGPSGPVVNEALLNDFEKNYSKAKEIFEKTKKENYLNILSPYYSPTSEPAAESENATSSQQ